MPGDLSADEERLRQFLANPKVPDEAKRKAVALHQQMQAEPATAPAPGREVSPEQRRESAVTRTYGATVGGELGYRGGKIVAPFLGPAGRVAPFVGALVGAGGGAAFPEGVEAINERLGGFREGRAPILPRMEEAGKTGMLSELGGRAVGVLGGKVLSGLGKVGGRIRSALGKTGEFDIPIGPGEQTAAKFAETRGASGIVTRAAQTQSDAIAKAGSDIMREVGAPVERSRWLDAATKSIRALARKRSIPKAEMDQLVSSLGLPPGTDLLALMKKNVRVAEVADRLANIPGGPEALMQRVGNQAKDAIARAWWESTLTAATGQEGLRKGLVDPQIIIQAFNKLPPKTREIYFQQQLPIMQRFVDALGETGVAGAGGGVPAPIPWSKLLGLLGLGGTAGRFIGPGRMAEAAVAGGVGYAIPIAGAALAAKALTSPGAAQGISTVLGGPGMQAAAQAFPTAARVGAQIIGQTPTSEAGAETIPSTGGAISAKVPLRGYLGILERPGGGFSSELNITVQGDDGRWYNTPMLVPGQVNVDDLLSGKKATKEQYQIAEDFLKKRRAAGKVSSFSSLDAALHAEKIHHEMLERANLQPRP
jgi:hypothetical protein